MIRAIPIEQIRHRADARHRDDAALNALAESMDEIGLINPIRVRCVGDQQYEVVAGSHRLQAAELLGWTEIAAVIALDDDLHAELVMIDENLIRAELSVVDRARQTARRKAIFILLHPETAQHAAGGYAKHNSASDNLSFAAETARATGRDERTIQRDASRGENIADEALNAVQGTHLETGVYLDRLKRVPADQQAETVRRDLSEPPGSSIARRYQPAPPKPDELFERFCGVAGAIAATDVKAIIEGAGRQRSVLGQYASSVIEKMEQILEGLG